MTVEQDQQFSRRSLLKWFAGLVAGTLLHQRLAAAATGEDESGLRPKDPLIVHVMRPFDAETPVREFTSFLTPNDRFFVRSHFGPPAPEQISEASWQLRVDGLVEEARTLRLHDLRRMEAVTIPAVLQCSGNGRAFQRPKTPGVQWERGAVGNAQWTGVRLRDVLAKAGVRPEARHIKFQGADRPVVSSVPLFTRSIPLEKALHPDTILAYEMNGRPLPLLHGAPLRVVTPGWMADSCTKWLTEITVQAEEAKGYYMQTAYRVPISPVELGGPVMAPVEAMVVKSLIAGPSEGETVNAGPVSIHGVAWSNGAKISAVEVSTDEGNSWEPARLVGEDHPYAWRQWQYVWPARNPGTFAILCRATDVQGMRQPATNPWNPSGFLWNGWDRVVVTVRA